MEISTLKLPAMFLSTISILEIRIPLSPRPLFAYRYLLFIAGVYALFRHGNNEALFLVQGFLDTLTCVLTAMLAWLWSAQEGQNRRAALGAFLLVAACSRRSIRQSC